MIPFNFDYVRAKTLREAVDEYTSFTEAGLDARYYAGGTEIITLARLHQLHTDAVIDIKPIPATRVITVRHDDSPDSHHDRLVIGAAVTLTQITEHPAMTSEFGLLQRTVEEIADRTARNKITVGGNICGEIFYREAILPLLVCDSYLRIAGPRGWREISIDKVFHQTIQLEPGEFVVQILTEKAPRTAPFVHIKRRKAGQVGYPILTAVAIRVNDEIRVAFSGLCTYPFRWAAIEAELNRTDIGFDERIERVVKLIPHHEILNDYEASRAYRAFVLRKTLEEIVYRLGGDTVD